MTPEPDTAWLAMDARRRAKRRAQWRSLPRRERGAGEVIEYHIDLILPWWIVPLFIGCIGLMAGLIIAIGVLADRWHR